jgi:hypothetical protein
MARFFCLLFFVIISYTSLAQISKTDSIFIKQKGNTFFGLMFLSNNGEAARIIAKQDLNNNCIIIFLSGGIHP